jgi:hypothetical protein
MSQVIKITPVVISRSLTSHLSELSPTCLRFSFLCNIAGVKLSFNIPLFCRLSSSPYNKSCPECVDPLPVCHTIATTPSGLKITCQEIGESDEENGHFATYCKRYWGTQMKDYGSSICPEADRFINRNKFAWKRQAERDASEHEDLEDRTPDEDGTSHNAL